MFDSVFRKYKPSALGPFTVLNRDNFLRIGGFALNKKQHSMLSALLLLLSSPHFSKHFHVFQAIDDVNRGHLQAGDKIFALKNCQETGKIFEV